MDADRVISNAPCATPASCEPRQQVGTEKSHGTATRTIGTSVPAHRRDKAQALADAQREFQRSAELGHPYYWAPFILVGTQRQAAADEAAGRS